jgi:thioredoxin:protein disulfide reductase
LMPKPGGWMTKITQFFGILMLGMAIFMLSRILPEMLTLVLWAMLAIGTAFYLGLYDGQSPSGFGGYMSKLFAILFMLYGAILFIGALSGADSVLRPLEPFSGEKQVMAKSPEKISKKGYSIARLEAEVAASSKPVIVDFGKDSCTACTELEEFTFPDLAVQKAMERFTFIKIDLTDNTAEDKALLKKFELFGTPNIIFFDRSNAYLPAKTLTGFVSPKKFAEHLETIE